MKNQFRETNSNYTLFLPLTFMGIWRKSFFFYLKVLDDHGVEQRRDCVEHAHVEPVGGEEEDVVDVGHQALDGARVLTGGLKGKEILNYT